MAYSDYTHCAKCDSKVFYDANVNYSDNTGSWYALCKECTNSYELVLQDKKTKGLLTPINTFLTNGVYEE